MADTKQESTGKTIIDRPHRVPVRVTVILKETTFDGSLYFFSKNLSANGMFLESEILLQEGVVVEVRFLLPDSMAPVRAVGRISRVEDRNVEHATTGFGIQFLEIEQSSREQLQTFLARRTP